MKLLTRAVFAIGAIVSLWLVFLSSTRTGAGRGQLILTFLFFAMLVGCTLLLRRLPEPPVWVCLILLAAVCLIPRILAIALFPVEIGPAHDFATYYRLADWLAGTGEFIESSCNLFPHMLFFSLYLSVFFRLFGASILTFQILNLVLSLLTVCLLFHLIHRLFGRKPALLAALVFTCSPTLILYAPLNCHEHLCLFLTTAFLCVLFHFIKVTPRTPAAWAGAGAALGALLLSVDLIRPVGIILLLTVLCWSFLHWLRERKLSIKPLPLLLALALFASIFYGGRELVYRSADGIRPQPLCRSSYAFTLLAGSNLTYGGTWNPNDSSIFSAAMRETYNRGFCYEEGAAKVMEVVKQRYGGMSLSQFVQLLSVKNGTLWGAQKSVVSYLTNYRDGTRPSLLDHPTITRWLGYSCDALVAACLLLMGLYCLFQLRKPEFPPLDPGLFGVIGFLGFFCVHSLTEAAGRYTVSAFPLMLLAMAAAFSGPAGGPRQKAVL